LLARYVGLRPMLDRSPEQFTTRLRRDHPQVMRRLRYRSGKRRSQVPNCTPIGLRPLEVETQRMPGHWENDLLKGRANRSAVGALIERTRPLMLPARLPGLDSHAMCRGFACGLAPVPAPLRKSLNYDQGREMARREPQRQYLPKHADLTRLSQRDLNAIVARSNNRPRKTLEWI
jgi:IS30 family transposase